MLDRTQPPSAGPEPEVRVVGFNAWLAWFLSDIRVKKAAGWYDQPVARMPRSIDGEVSAYGAHPYLHHNDPDAEGAGL